MNKNKNDKNDESVKLPADDKLVSRRDSKDNLKPTLSGNNKSLETPEDSKPAEIISCERKPSEVPTKSPLLSVRKPIHSDPVNDESRANTPEGTPMKLPGEDDIELHTDLDVNKPAKSTSATLER